MLEEKLIHKLELFSRKLHERKDPAHDFSHIQRIIRLCKEIAPLEADIDLIVQAAYFHGVLRKKM